MTHERCLAVLLRQQTRYGEFYGTHIPDIQAVKCRFDSARPQSEQQGLGYA